MKKKIIIAISCIVVCLGAVFVYFNQKPKFKLVIDNNEISEQLYLELMQSNVANVVNEVYEKYGLEVDENFWTSEIDEGTPLAMLQERTLDTLIKASAYYNYAQDLNLETNGGLQTLEQRLVEENKRREEAVANGEIIYGLKQYDLKFFLNYEIELIHENICYDMEFSSDELHAYYEEHLDDFKQDDQLKIEALRIYYVIDEQLLEKYDTIKKDLETIVKRLPSESLESLAKEYQLDDYYVSIDSTTVDLDIDGDIYELAKDMQSGEVSELMDVSGCFYLVKCQSRQARDVLSYDEAKNTIKSSLAQESFELAVQDYQDKVVVDIQGDLNNWMINCLNNK